MTLRCLLFGCKWSTGMRFITNREHLVLQQCNRCSACRTVAE